jgi:cyclopropane-fatty-acyl-phospholipid synthase
MGPMQNLIPKIESQLASLPVPIALELPDGRRVAQAGARVTLAFKEWTVLAKLAARQVGAIAKGRMRDLMTAAAHLLPGSPVGSDTGWWTQMLRRAKSLAPTRRSATPSRSSSTTTSRTISTRCGWTRGASTRAPTSASPAMSLAQAQEAKLDHICRKLMLRPASASSTSAPAGAGCCCGRPSTTASTPPASRCRATSTRTCSG